MKDADPATRRPATSEDTAEADTNAGDHRPTAAQPRHLPVDPDVPEHGPASARRRAARVLRDRWDVLLVIAAGGALGSLARWTVTAVVTYTSVGVPWATWWENVTGAFILGALMVFILDVWPPSRYVRPFLGVGILGGYTTFSTYMLDTRTLLSTGQVPAAFGYLFGTLLAGLFAVWAGVLLARTAVTAVERRHQHRHRRRFRDVGRASATEPDPDHDSDHDPADPDLDARSGR